jgi:CelD/BcsL family acetyltransferase involved in cellulose biosynthesis
MADSPLSPTNDLPVCSVLSDPAQLQQLVPEWQALLERSGSNEPVLSPLWMLSWWKVFGHTGGRQLRVACFRRGGRLIGLAPFLRRRSWYRPGIPFRRLEPLGTGEGEHEEVCPEYLNLLAEQGAEKEVAAALARALVAKAFGSWDELLLPRMDGDSAMLALVTAACHQAGLRCTPTSAGAASYIPLPASWDDYLASLPSSHRYFVRQSLRRFERWANKEDQLHIVRSADDLAQGKQVLASLHQGRWGEDVGLFGSPRFAAFHDAILPALLARGALELLWLSVRGEPVAAAYNILWNNKVHFYQSGRKVDIPSGVRPGIVLHVHAIQLAIAARRREYDFLGGDEHYKSQMGLASRPLVDLRIVRPSLREQARLLAGHGRRWARSIRQALRRRSTATGERREEEERPVSGEAHGGQAG